MNKDSLGDRMKKYENIERNHLTPRMPMIMRLDGKAFHSFTRDLDRPFDIIFMKTMQDTAKYLCEQITGSKVAYVQSDEISVLITDYDGLNTQAWFDKNIQKMVSISASMCTARFNDIFCNLGGVYLEKAGRAIFDSRVFVIPEPDVVNYFVWRQQDATRNAIQMLGRANFSHKQMDKKNCNDIQEMLFQVGINFNDLEIDKKRGCCVIKQEYLLDDNILRTRWVVDTKIPVFTQDRNYIEKLLPTAE